MADVAGNEDGQLMLLTVFMILIGVVSFVGILNNMIFSANLQSTGLEGSKEEIRDLRLITETEIAKAAYYSNTSVADPANQTQVIEYFNNYMMSYNETISRIYSARGASVEILVNNISLNKTTSNMTVNKYYIEWTNHTFPYGSLVIPMDDNQSTSRTQLMKVYGLVYKIVDGSGPSELLNGTSIPVWMILQNPVNNSVDNFSSSMNTKNASTGYLPSSYREYSGGPFIIDYNDIPVGKRDSILNEANNLSIKVHSLESEFSYEKAVKMVVPPKVAMYPKSDPGPMTTYYSDGQVPYTPLNQSQMQDGTLNQFDILTIPHENMLDNSSGGEGTIKAIVGWVANGGVLHVQCEGTDTMDAAVEKWAGSGKSWYGFIGINKSKNNITESTTFIKLLDNTTRFNTSYSFNVSPLLPVAGLADPGTPFSPLAQSSNISGIFGSAGGSTKSFSLRRNASQVNPAANILGYAAYANGTGVYVDADDPPDGYKDIQLMYIEAPYENGLVTYLAGHDQSDREGFAERFIFETFFAASMRMSLVTGITAKNINVTIKYFDGDVRYTDTFIINT